ncbi:appr-1-p processing enzyme family domain-containing protein [Bifidobacterium samirii]|uniref:Appr-1-p processing enzyme family domain-containing protein n=2 Tax=Bifidobacterium samirii TaxID=2306974 RepID=A0A430FUT5_9BIFI|nr:appr-1-p processing enzyme family domain-containing protein [Bifidobacterium samirii]
MSDIIGQVSGAAPSSRPAARQSEHPVAPAAPRTQSARLERLIGMLLAELQDGDHIAIPGDEAGRRELLRALVNIRPPMPAPDGFLDVQDAYLRGERERPHAAGGVVDVRALPPYRADDPGIVLWQGDITRLRADAIVNAANDAMLGCFRPNHHCIDNAIHTFAGIQLRAECAAVMDRLGRTARTGEPIVTGGWNLPADHVIHVTGPIVDGPLTDAHRKALADCYRNCLAAADARGLRSVAFCSISTGVFGFPIDQAAPIAVATVRAFLRERRPDHPHMTVVFDVFSDHDRSIYEQALHRPVRA